MSPTAKADALAALAREHDEVTGLVDRLAPGDAVRPGLGGGEWSPKDLLGHLTSWEEYALAAMGAWLDGRTAPIDQALRSKGLTAVNREAVARKAGRPYPAVRGAFDEVHRALLDALKTISPERWDAPATTRSKRSLGERIGGVLGGAGGGYHHAASHLPDLRAFVAQHAR
jgi:hypothetical protein